MRVNIDEAFIHLLMGVEPEYHGLEGYPWIQYRHFVAPHQRPLPDPNCFAYMDLDEDESGSDYAQSESSSEDSSSSDSDSDAESDIDMEIPQDEITALLDEACRGKYHSWDPEEAFSKAKAELEELEKLASTIYNPDEVVSLLTEFFELMVEMGHWPQGSIHHGPHTIDMALGEELGYETQVLDLMQKLPYLDDNCNHINHDLRICDSVVFADYRTERALKAGRIPGGPRTEFPEEVIESHMLPIVYPDGPVGLLMLLDTKLGAS